MVKKTLTTQLFLLLIMGIGHSQSNGYIPALTAADLPGAEITGTREYSYESLYGYIDGGAELYLEYGFDTLCITDIIYGGAELKAEIYRMKDEEAAFGIFSVSRFKCIDGIDLTEHFCRSKYQLQFCKGPYYVSIVNSTATSGEQKLSEQIAVLLIERISNEPFISAGFFPDTINAGLMKSAVLVRGRMGLFNGAYGLSELLEECEGFTALIIKPEGVPVISVRFDNDEDMRKFIGKEKIDFEELKSGDEIAASSGDLIMMTGDKTLVIREGKSF